MMERGVANRNPRMTKRALIETPDKKPLRIAFKNAGLLGKTA
jgi:hypothetical protein